MIWHFLRYLVTFSLPAFYRKIQGKNQHRIQSKGPAIIAMNHPNAFMDPVCITWVTYPVRVNYMARGDAFKSGFMSWFLVSLGVVPIFRLRDGGREGLAKNEDSYEIVNKLLKRNAKVIIFAEGLCVQERRLRPLKKGVARMVFGAHEYLKNDNLTVIPVGVNYTQPDKFRTKLFYNVGNPIPITQIVNGNSDNQLKAYNAFLKNLDEKMRELVTHINNPEYDKLVPQLEEMLMREWLIGFGLKPGLLENEFVVTKKITELVNNSEKSAPEKLNILKEKTALYFTNLRKNGLRDWLLSPFYKITYPVLALRLLALIFLLPIYTLGFIAAWLPYKLTILLTKKVVKGNREFYSSMAVGIGSFLFLFNYLLWFFFIYLFSPSILWPLLLTAVLMGSSWLSMLIHTYIKKTKGVWNALSKPELYHSFALQRKEIIILVDELTKIST